jgi:methyl-accepting chemotaxis protein
MLTYLTFKTRMLLGFCSIIVLITIVLNVSLNQFSKIQDEILKHHTLQENALITDEIAFSILQAKQFFTNAAITHNQKNYLDAEAAANSVKKHILFFRERENVDQKQLQKLDSLETNFNAFLDEGKKMATAYLTEGVDAGNILNKDLEKKWLVLDEQVKQLRRSFSKENIQIDRLSQLENDATKTLMLLSIFVTIAGLGVAIYLTRYLNNQLGIDPYFAKGIAKEIAKGDLSRAIRVNEGDTKSLLFALEKMRQHLLVRKVQDQNTLKEVMRIKFALDTVSVGVMITDDQHFIIYANEELNSIFKKSATEITDLIPGFSVDTLIGKKITELTFIPEIDELFNSLTDSKRIPVALGGHHMVIVITPVFNEQGEQLGTVSEWHDHTEEVLVENELAAVVAAASMGDFTRAFNVQGKDGVMRLLGEGINQLMHTNKVSLNEISRVLSAITQGNLTETITNQYFGTFGELKQSTNATVDTLKGIITQIKEVTDIIHNGAREIASGNNDLSQRTENQAISLQETTTSMKELTTAVQNNAENSKKANQLAIRATEVASKGGYVISNVIETMKGINDSSKKVVDIISVIDGIAFQTNILALNAAVEAARAGEQGRGFAVVASEVRNLAKRAALAAGEIKSLIGNSVEKIEDGTKLVAQAGKTMDEILNSIEIVSVIMGNITAASAEQSIGIEQVNKAIAQMDGVTQQNAALVEEAAAASESVEEQAQNLARTVESFKLE